MLLMKVIFDILVLVSIFILSSFVLRYGVKGTTIKRDFIITMIVLLLLLWRM